MTLSVGNRLAAKRLRVKAKKRQARRISTADATCNGHGRFTVKLKPNAQAEKP